MCVNKFADVQNVKGLFFYDNFASTWIGVNQSTSAISLRNNRCWWDEELHAVLAGDLSNLSQCEVASHYCHVLFLHLSYLKYELFLEARRLFETISQKLKF